MERDEFGGRVEDHFAVFGRVSHQLVEVSVTHD